MNPDDTRPGDRPDDGQAALAAVAGLAREIEALAREVAALRPVPAQLADLAGIVAVLSQQAGGPQPGGPGAVPAAPAGGAGSAGEAGSGWSWLDHDGDFAEAVALLADLTAWMGEVYLRYPDAVGGLPECWLWHPDLVEELLWLRAAWLAAYRGEKPLIALAGDWHDRARPGVVRRIKAVAGTCSLECHQARGDHHRGAAPVPLAEAIHLIGDWWATAREATAPEPDAGHLAAAEALRVPRGRR
jgi:hypothetical protein